MGKVFAKPALSPAGQIAHLKRKKLHITNEAAAQHALTHIGYYHLSAYWFPYKISAGASRAFRPGTDFAEIVRLYEFDRSLKLLLMAAIERIEIAVRESFVRSMSLKYGAHGYLDWQHYKTAAPLAKIINDTNRELQKPNNLFTRHYKQVYDRPLLPPLWIMAELLTFGTLSKLAADLRQPADRNALARQYGLDEIIFMRILRSLSYIRNICAHHGRLWNRSLATMPPIAQNPRPLRQTLNESCNNKIYNALVYIAYLLNSIIPQSRWKTKLKHLIRARPAYADLNSMGFPPDWQLKPLWR